MNGEGDNIVDDAFREVFKYYKRKRPPPDFSNVIDFQNESSFEKNGIIRLPVPHSYSSIHHNNLEGLGLKNVDTWNILQLEAHPGLIFIPNPFTDKGVEYWVNRALESYCRPPNPTNLPKLLDESDESLHLEDTILKQLRWATLGYHHNWDTKEYSESYRGEFPEDLSALSKVLAAASGFPDFEAEAAIVNYYAMDSSIGGHTDHSEKNHEAPLLSVSFGQSAIFLLGGKNKSIRPTAMYLRNGDVVIMSGKSRLCYHGVPRIIHDSSFKIQGRWSSVLSQMRLNLNVRQVNYKY